MADFVADTAIEPVGAGRYRARLSEAWKLWGPAGGYVSSIALRAAGATTALSQPVSFACQYLSVARFAEVELHVESLRRGKRSEALRVSMTQDGQPILVAQVWAMATSEGMAHDYVPAPALPAPETLPPLEELEPARTPHPYFENFEQRPVGHVPDADRTPREPELRGFYRFRPRARGDDAWADAARAVILIDTFTWPATWPAHPSPGPSPWIAPNLDLYVRFHRDLRPHEWLYHVGRADLAEGGLIAAQGTLFAPDGRLLASGATQLLCVPRPAQFR